MSYLHWAKTHPRVRYELTSSGVPPASPDDLGEQVAPLTLEVQGTYGDPALIEAISARYNVPGERIVPVPGTSTANFIALATAMRHRTECTYHPATAPSPKRMPDRPERGEPAIADSLRLKRPSRRPDDDTICERVAIETPVYDPLPRAAFFLGFEVIPLLRRPEDAFGITPQTVQDTLDRGACAVFLTNLHNPSGQLLPPDAVRRLAEVCDRSGAMLIVDEVYLDANHLNHNQPRWTAATLADNIIVTNSLTKVYGLGGLRVGWLIAPPGPAEQAREIMDLLSVENSAPAAAIAAGAMTQIDRLEDRFRRHYHAGKPVFRKWLDAEPLVRGYPSFGALFECVRLPEGVTPEALNDRLVSTYETQVVPGGFFGSNDHIRVSIVAPPDDLREGLNRVSLALRDLTS